MNQSIRRILRPLKPIARRVRDAAYALLPRSASRRYQGYRIFFNRGNALVARLRTEPVFEAAVSAYIVAQLPRDSVMIDVGANIGLVSLYALAHRPNLRVVAIEPGPVQYGFLRKTIEFNGLSERARLFNCALSERSGTMDFFTHTGGDQAKDGLIDTGRGSKTTKISVPVRTLDEVTLAEGLKRVDLIKIDTEGAELFVLRGARETLKWHRPTIVFELERSNLKAYPYGPSDIIDWLSEQGYRVETLEGHACTRENLEEMMVATDTFVALPG
jgi:FkbM family methyltransferase